MEAAFGGETLEELASEAVALATLPAWRAHLHLEQRSCRLVAVCQSNQCPVFSESLVEVFNSIQAVVDHALGT